LSCKFCEFYRKDGDDGAYTRDMEYIREQARGAVEAGATEIHSVGGLHPSLPFSYYTDLVATIRGEASRLGSDLHVKAFTAVEIVHLARIAKVYKGATLPGEEGRAARRAGIRHVLSELKKAGLGSLPGGGAEVFDDRVHDQAYKGKIRSDVWLDVHRVAHELGLNTNATILYGHIESRIDRLTHMDMLRRAQDEALARLGYAGVSGRGLAKRSAAREGKPDTGVGVEDDPGTGEGDLARSEGGHLGARAGEVGDSNAPIITLTRPGTPLPERVSAADGVGTCPCGYYQTIIPLPFFPDGSELERLPGPSGLENLRTIAVSRLMLDNFPHVKAFWIMQTLPMSQVMLAAGADDIDGTVVWYDITKVNHGAGQGAGAAATNQEVNVWTLRKAIREAGFEPIERDTLYRRVIRDGSNGRLWRTEPFGVPPAHGIR
ncbi:MAG: radical SAM protein, partial [Phycisphaerae bacterium]|nr:radical SAM protein [Phycisphaerae bacterium]